MSAVDSGCRPSAFATPSVSRSLFKTRWPVVPDPSHFIVGRADQIACVSFADEFGDGATRKDGNIVGVGLDGSEYSAGMRSAGSGALDKNAFGDGRHRDLWRRAGLLRNVGTARAQQRATDQKITDEVSTFHGSLQGKPRRVSPRVNFGLRRPANS